MTAGMARPLHEDVAVFCLSSTGLQFLRQRSGLTHCRPLQADPSNQGHDKEFSLSVPICPQIIPRCGPT
jgi:hypothetical protein